ncbi:Hypothetical predicted protein [Olea europaea subsp. europaea]|uniref:Uncharacterized protein n=1 Tax=Olea europaea subsp. europaea TaxID=158383 RepID=A0A8S0SME8_OLEEU|nr:Hypothetical predicted protein [Olea europaea subsp. europaea]
MRHRREGRAIHRVIMNHRSNGWKPASTFYLINVSLPEVGVLWRINQVAFLFDVDIAWTENARSRVIGGSTSSYPLGVSHLRIRAHRRGPSPTPRVTNGVEHSVCFLVHLQPRLLRATSGETGSFWARRCRRNGYAAQGTEMEITKHEIRAPNE